MQVFVYGTLKRGFGNHRVMQMAEGRFVDESTIAGTMFSYGGFPAICLDGPDIETIHGEVYEVDPTNIGPVDSLEGYPGWYDRTPVKDSRGENVWVYHMPYEHLSTRPKVEGGIWL